MTATMKQPVFRFAPSPNGYLHLGHALSALIDFEMARALGGRFLLRIEDIDATRCRPEFEQAIYEDLEWLGIAWDGSVRRQSDHLDAYRQALLNSKRGASSIRVSRPGPKSRATSCSIPVRLGRTIRTARRFIRAYRRNSSPANGRAASKRASPIRCAST
jgi:hypothetical protein